MAGQQLKQSILNQSYQVLEAKGLSAIRMRDLAKACQCAVGTIYNVFATFEEIHFHLNLLTFRKLIKRLHDATQEGLGQNLTFEELFPKVGWEYIRFAKEETNAWKALFEQAPENEPPDWYRAEIDRCMMQIEELLQRHFQISRERVSQLINYFWFAIHGVSSIVLNKKATNHSDEFVDSYVDHCLRGIYHLI